MLGLFRLIMFFDGDESEPVAVSDNMVLLSKSDMYLT